MADPDETSSAAADIGNQTDKLLVEPIDTKPTQAYAKLEGEGHCYYLRTLQVTLGRNGTKTSTVDIPLGNAKSISRRHARLFYNFTTQRFEIMVFGKNGAFINEQFIERGVTVPLENRAKIQIGGVSFKFLLPRMSLDPEEHKPAKEEDNVGDVAMDLGEPASSQSCSSNKDGKPPYSYATLIAQAINSTEDKRMALHEIYNYITTHYPYFQMAQNGWQNSIRHNLSLNKAFVKMPRGDAAPGKGSFWTIDPNADLSVISAGTKKAKRSSSKQTDESSSSHRKEEDSDSPEVDNSVPMSPLPMSSAPVTAAATADVATGSTHKKAMTSILPQPVAGVITPVASVASASASPSRGNTRSEPFQPVSTAQPTAQLAVQLTTQSTAQPSAQSALQTQIQLQLQTTIRQHLLDPVRFPLPPSIAQLLPQAIAQLPPHLASQFSSTLQSAMRAHASAASSSSSLPSSTNTNNATVPSSSPSSPSSSAPN